MDLTNLDILVDYQSMCRIFTFIERESVGD